MLMIICKATCSAKQNMSCNPEGQYVAVVCVLYTSNSAVRDAIKQRRARRSLSRVYRATQPFVFSKQNLVVLVCNRELVVSIGMLNNMYSVLVLELKFA